jgi:NAD(P)-dependent dehydrogenase (short-subunit alcohol dehydrogenase family)
MGGDPVSGPAPTGGEPLTEPAGLCAGRVVVVTGAGRGLGRAHALAFAAAGACVVVNDCGVEPDGTGGSTGPAARVAAEIAAAGGRAVANSDDVADWAGAGRLVLTALRVFGRLDVLVNNAGFVRDRTLVNLTEAEWDAVVRVHLKGHFLPLRHAAGYWRERARAGEPVDARVINTSSGAGLRGSVGQANYAAAKAGIAALTAVAAAELAWYGVTVNAIAPAARTRMTERVFAATMAPPETGFDAMAPENVSPLVVWLGSAASSHVTGRLFEVEGGVISLATGWRRGPCVARDRRWDPAELGPAVDRLLAEAPAPEPVYGTVVTRGDHCGPAAGPGRRVRPG